jgi:hypothetical protein
MAVIYKVDGSEYIQLTRWKERVRTASRFPNQSNDSQMTVKCLSNACQMLGSPPSPSPSPCTDTHLFEAPTIEAVKLQCAKIGLPDTEAQHFLDFYESKGWVVGQTPMKSWAHALSNWKRTFDEKRYANRNNSQRPAASVERPDRNVGTHNKADGRYAAHAARLQAVALGKV